MNYNPHIKSFSRTIFKLLFVLKYIGKYKHLQKHNERNKTETPKCQTCQIQLLLCYDDLVASEHHITFTKHPRTDDIGHDILSVLNRLIISNSGTFKCPIVLKSLQSPEWFEAMHSGENHQQ